MTRTLPWLNKPAANNKPRTPGRSSTLTSRDATTPRPSTTYTLHDVVSSDLDDLPSTTTRPKPPSTLTRTRTADRTPSTSPPPPPPSIEYMQEGYNADDRWRMVEDEFHSTAMLFTQHIHHAEYMRLKRLAAARGKKTLSRLERTDGTSAEGMSAGVRAKVLRREREGKRREVLGGDGEEIEGEEEDEFGGDMQLTGLMTTGSRTVMGDLSRFARAKGSTRAAAGCERSPQKAVRTRDVIAEERRAVNLPASRITAFLPSDEEDLDMELSGGEELEESETDDDDLDAFPTLKANKSSNGVRPMHADRPITPTEPRNDSIANSYATPSHGSVTALPIINSPMRKSTVDVSTKRATSDKLIDPISPNPKTQPYKGGKGAKAAEYMARRLAERQAREQELDRNTLTPG